MNRSEAIDQVIGYIQQIDSEWGPGGDTDEEAIEVLTALGVTRDELIAHNVIQGGYYHHLFLEVAELLSAGRDREAVRKIAVNCDHKDPTQNQWRTVLFKRSEPSDGEAA